MQLRKGFLELCVLNIVHNKGAAYGQEILQTLEQTGLQVNEGTLYPLLNRMYKNGWLESDWERLTSSGHPRRFYKLSEVGIALLPEMRDTYRANTASLDALANATSRN